MQLDDEPLLNFTNKQMSDSLNICLKSAESKINLVNNFEVILWFGLFSEKIGGIPF